MNKKMKTHSKRENTEAIDCMKNTTKERNIFSPQNTGQKSLIDGKTMP